MFGRSLSVTVFVALSLVVSFTVRSSDVKTPDFAFPKTVVSESLAGLDDAMRAGDGKAMVRSLLDFTMAKLTIGQSNMPECISLIDSVRNAAAGDAVTQSMLDLLEAVVYNSGQRPWQGTPVSADTVGSLLDRCLSHGKQLAGVRLSDWKGVITQNHWTTVYYPALYNFAVSRAVEIYRGMNVNPVLLDSKITALYDSVIAVSRGGSAPEIDARLHLLEWELDNGSMTFGMSEAQRVERYISLYESYIGNDGKPVSEFAGDILLRLPVWGDGLKREYGLIRSFLKSCPSYWRKADLERNLAQITQKRVECSLPDVTGPGREIGIKLRSRNATSVTLEIYNVSSSSVTDENITFSPGVNGIVRVASIPVAIDGGSLPFVREVTVPYAFAKEGNYIVVPVIKGERRSREGFGKIHVTGVAMFTTAYIGSELWTVDPAGGAPLSGVSVNVKNPPYGSKGVTRRIGVTGSDGSVRLGDTRGVATAVKGNDRFAKPLYIYNNVFTPADEWNKAAQGFTSLPLYHHGDTVRWTALCYEFKGAMQRPFADRKVTAVLWDANSIPVDTLECVTDRWGRAEGLFVLPSDGLSGRFRIDIDGFSRVMSFEVSDYKLPSFKIENLKVERNTPSEGDVELSGRAFTYSGFPVEGARVKITVRVSGGSRYWFRGPSYDVCVVDTVSGADGAFRTVLKDSVLSASAFPKGYYTATVDVTSQAGESQTGTVGFARGERYFIRGIVPANFNMRSGCFPVEAKVANYEDSTVRKPVKVSLRSENDSLDLVSADILDKGTLDVAALQQGRYVVEMSSADADTVRLETVLYDPRASSSPVHGDPVWAPEWKSLVDCRSGSGRWLYAVDVRQHILATLWTPDSIISRRWVDASPGYNTLDVNLPAGVDKATLSIIGTANYRQMSGNVEIKRAESDRGLRIVTETFRDRTAPGEIETWKFRVVDLDGKGREAAVIADMYNTALDPLAQTDWSLRLRRGSERSMRSALSLFGGIVRDFTSVPLPRSKGVTPSLVTPEFNTYGIPMRGYMNGSVRMMKYAAARDEAYVESVDADGGGMAVEMKMFKAENAMADATAVMATGVSELSEETVEEESVEDAASDGDNARELPFDYRDSDVMLAFFQPRLVTDDDGRLSLQFEVPAANTTWGFRMLAFTDSLISAGFSRDVVASRKVMVDPNLPRFVRTGDTVVVPASVMNASDSTAVVVTTIEIFNPLDGVILQKSVTCDTICRAASALATITIDVPSGISLLGYRVRSVGDDGSSDGEQSLLPVLPAVTPVIETYPFYIAAGQRQAEVRLPECPDNADVLLQICNDPSWYIVTALPGLLANEATTAPEAARALFSAAVAEGIIKRYPQVADALREWTGSGSSSLMLTSMLSRNEELKTVLLNATPWMTDARDDTERMQRLALLFDGKFVDKVIGDNIAVLSRLSDSGGGWRWCGSSGETSRWATRQVLSLMGRLCRLGYMPADKSLVSMVRAALAWDNAVTQREFKKYPDGDYTDCVYIHDLFSSSSCAVPADPVIVHAATQRILKNWRNSTVGLRAIDVQVMHAHGYENVARTMIESIGQLGESTPEKGMWFPSLDDSRLSGPMFKNNVEALVLETYVAVDPGCPQIDRLRQWLIMQKGAQNWGSSPAAAQVVASILSASPVGVAIAGLPEIRIGGERMSPSVVERITGECQLMMPSRKVSGKRLRLDGLSGNSAWGAVYCKSTQSSGDLRASSCPELSVGRSIHPSGSDGTLKAGSRVTVRLEIKADADMDYVTVVDERPACFEPVQQMPGMAYADGIGFYRESRDASTRFFIDHLPKGAYTLTYDVWVNNAGTYLSGPVSVQSQYAPQFSAHSAGCVITVARQ